MDETRLRTIEQLQQFLSATPEVAFTPPEVRFGADNQRYEHISRTLGQQPCRAASIVQAIVHAIVQAIPRPGRALRAQVHGWRLGAAGGEGSGP